MTAKFWLALLRWASKKALTKNGWSPANDGSAWIAPAKTPSVTFRTWEADAVRRLLETNKTNPNKP